MKGAPMRDISARELKGHHILAVDQAALLSQKRREIKIKRYARIIEGHILDFKPDKRRRHP